MDTKSGNCSDNCENSGKVGHRLTASSTNTDNCPGCGLNDLDKITITVAPTTGGRFDISVQKNIAVENLKKVISKKLKVPKERILLLHKERQLRDGNLQQNSICNGSTLTLLPSVETGLLSQRPEQGVMQALESLNDSQVNDFLSGKAPLNLTMRLGDHMMLIQLQLSSVTPSTSRKTSSTSVTPATSSSATSSTSAAKMAEPQTQKPILTVPGPSTQADPPPAPTGPSSPSEADLSLPNLSLINSKLNTLLHKNSENLNALKRKLSSGEEERKELKKSKAEAEADDSKNNYLKDLNLKNVLLNVTEPSTSKSTKYTEMMKDSMGSQPSPDSPQAAPGTSSSTDLQAKKTEILSQIMESVRRISENTNEMTQAIEAKVCDKGEAGTTCTCKGAAPSTSGGTGAAPRPSATDTASLDTKALAEASRNLTQTLKQLSSEVLTCRSETTQENCTSVPCTSRRRPGTQGAIIESMQHHGKGVFSGTFSGTLNPALQDRYGRPKRDISTIIHILNDLLCATPQYRRQRQSTQASAGAKPHSQETAGGEGSSNMATEIVSVENEATRGKLERLRMVMEQNRARRRARREAKGSDPTTPDIIAMDDLDSNQDPTELMEINPPEPVVA